MSYRKNKEGKQIRGFLGMTPEQRRKVARKGGLTISRNRKHMAKIGKIGGQNNRKKAPAKRKAKK